MNARGAHFISRLWHPAPVLFALAAPACLMEVHVGDDVPDDPVHTVDRIDLDQDGFSVDEGDCDDLDAERGPGEDPQFAERCDGIDNDCTGLADATWDGLMVCAREVRFVQRLEVDVLLVVDRSHANDYARSRAADAAFSFLEHLVGPANDTHIGVLTMDLDDPEQVGRLVRPDGFERRRWIDGRSDPVFVATQFLRAALVDSGVQLEGLEGGRAAVFEAMGERSDEANTGFFRPETPLSIVFVSAEEDASAAPGVFEFVDLLDEWALSNRVHAVVQTSELGCDGKPNAEDEGDTYLELVNLTNGLSQSVCEASYAPFFSALGQYTAMQGLETRFALPEAAQGATVSVDLELPDGLTRTLRPDEYGLSDNDSSLVLLVDPPPPAGTVITVDYLRKY